MTKRLLTEKYRGFVFHPFRGGGGGAAKARYINTYRGSVFNAFREGGGGRNGQGKKIINYLQQKNVFFFGGGCSHVIYT